TRQEFLTHVGIKPQALALTPDERFLAVVDSGGGRLSLMRAATGDLITSIPVGADPVDVVIPGWIGKQ
ncbi:MAG: YncE family protein, partial [Terriglobia bacterium]